CSKSRCSCSLSLADNSPSNQRSNACCQLFMTPPPITALTYQHRCINETLRCSTMCRCAALSRLRSAVERISSLTLAVAPMVFVVMPQRSDDPVVAGCKPALADAIHNRYAAPRCHPSLVAHAGVDKTRRSGDEQ